MGSLCVFEEGGWCGKSKQWQQDLGMGEPKGQSHRNQKSQDNEETKAEAVPWLKGTLWMCGNLEYQLPLNRPGVGIARSGILTLMSTEPGDQDSVMPGLCLWTSPECICLFLHSLSKYCLRTHLLKNLITSYPAQNPPQYQQRI